MRVIGVKQIEIYVTRNGKKPFIVWLESLKDLNLRSRVKEKLDRVSLGNMGDYKYLAEGISEFRLDFGPGYRIYFGENSKNFVLLLCGGNKTTQKKDIKRAITYWKDYVMRGKK